MQGVWSAIRRCRFSGSERLPRSNTCSTRSTPRSVRKTLRRCSSVVKSVSGVSRRATAATCRRPMPDSSTCFAPAPSRRARVGGSVVVFDDGFDLRLLGVRPRERGEPGAQLRVGLGGPAPGQRAPRAVEQQSPSEPVVSGQQRGAPPRLERDLAGRSDVRYADVSQHFVEPLDGFLNRSTVHPRPRGADPRNSQCRAFFG